MIALNIFFYAFYQPYNLKLQTLAVWSLDATDIEENNRQFFDSEPLVLETITSDVLTPVIDPLKVVGYLAIPNVQLTLPILRGASSANLDVSATTVRDEQVMGVGNYPIAGHRTVHPNTLFSPLARVEIGDDVYLSDKKNIYRYRVRQIDIVLPEQGDVLFDPLEGAITTLITCYGKQSEFRKVIVADLIETIIYSEKDFTRIFTN